MKVKDSVPFDVGLFQSEYLDLIDRIRSPKELDFSNVSNAYANEYVYHHHYLHRKVYIARNICYGIHIGPYCVGIAIFGYPVWQKYPGLVPPFLVDECPELIRLCTMANLPRNTESYFVAKCIKSLKVDWEIETGHTPKAVTSFCDLALGFDGALYKALNFTLLRITNGRPSNPGGPHGKWGDNTYKQEAKKAFYVWYYDRKR